SNSQELLNSHKRMATLLKFPNSDQNTEALEKLGRYGLGTMRSFESYLEFSGINTMTFQIDARDKCIRPYIGWNDSSIKQQITNLNSFGKTALLRDMRLEDAANANFLTHIIGVDITKLRIHQLLNTPPRRQVDINNLPIMESSSNKGSTGAWYSQLALFVVACNFLVGVICLILKSKK
ncbi:hypothetical protein RFI_11092, partial [Reticulomyxa filosa]